jgi:DNA polymerase-3 subunit alpha
VITLPPGECPPRLFKLLGEHKGTLPVFLDYRSKEGVTARVKAGPDLKLKHDPDLAEKLAKACGCGLSWMY